jgi:hypothetical protein
LQTVIILKGLLDSVERPVGIGLPLDRVDFCAGGFGRKHGAGLHRIAVYMDDASPALARITAYMCACQPKFVTQKLHQKRTALGLARHRLTVDCHVQLQHGSFPQF